MTMTNITRKRIIALLIVAVLLLASVVVYRAVTFRVVSTNPDTSSVSQISPFLKINFNKKITGDVSLTSSPNIILSHSVSDKTISLTLDNMELGKNYTITINSVTSTGGDVIKDKVISFTTQDISFSSLPADQQKAILANQDKLPKASDDPVFKYVPHRTIEYLLNALVRPPSKDNPSGIYLHADIYLSMADASGDVPATINQYEQDVVTYIRSTGLDPAKYHIEYNVILPDSGEE